jgi:magnesium chelatase family protein
MSVARIQCRAQLGLLAPPVLVEVHLGSGLPMFSIVGLPAAAVKESKERVRAALANSGFEFPAGRITVNLAPADLPKDGGRFDLAVAIGILVASGQLSASGLERCEVYGELGLSGELRPAPGLLLAAMHAAAARRAIVVPRANAAELRSAPLPAIHARIFPADDLGSVCTHLGGSQPLADLTALHPDPDAAHAPTPLLDLADIVGQAPAKRALLIAAAGGHSLLMIGPPGCGKSMLAQRLPGILPPLSAPEHVEVAGIRSVCGMASGATAANQRPFRAPHHTASASAIIGGGPQARPGEITLAHHGVLFLDELPEYDRRVREALREPLESGVIAVTRVGLQCEYPARFQLVAAMNPCPCGYLGDPSGRCRCTPNSLQHYQARLSGPLLDRIDLRVQLTRVAESEWLAAAGASGPNTAEAAAQVMAARRIQLERNGVLNSALSSAQLAENLGISTAARQLLLAASGKMQFSARAKQRVERVARTLADLEASAAIAACHVAEALQLRRAS